MAFENRTKPEVLQYVPGTGSLGYLTAGKHKTLESGLKRLDGLRIAVGVLVFVALAAGVYLTVVTYILPSVQVDTPVSAQIEQAADIASESSTTVYHPTAGLPVYNNSEIIFLINEKTPLSESYQMTLTEVAGIQVDQRIREALMAMTEKAQQDGVTIAYASGYVSPKKQLEQYNTKVQELIDHEKHTKIMAKAKAKSVVPRPMESDAQTGLCVTLQGDKATMVDTEIYRWLVKNAADFGFVFRYPENKTAQTGIAADLRVLRYVGNDNAIKMRQLSMCLEEYQKSIGV